MHEMSVDVQQDCTIKLLVYDMGLQNLVVEGLRGTFCAGHLDSDYPGSLAICGLYALFVFLEVS